MPNYRIDGNMGFISTNDLSAAGSYGKVVKIDSSNAPTNIVLAGANGTAAIGVLIDTPAAGQTGTVRLRTSAGTSFIRLGGTVAVGDAITSNASALGITTVTAGDQIIGYALSAGVSGDIIEILSSTGKY
jgi:hypothetical protein